MKDPKMIVSIQMIQILNNLKNFTNEKFKINPYLKKLT